MDELSFFKIYDAVDFGYKTGDTNYIIHDLSGIIIYKYNIMDCYSKMDEIYKELLLLFKNAKKLAREQSYEKRKIEMYLKDAINRESLKKNKTKEYE